MSDFIVPVVKVVRGDSYAIINESDLTTEDVLFEDPPIEEDANSKQKPKKPAA